MNSESPHLSLEDLIQSAEGASRDEKHLANCPTCQARVRDWNRISEAVTVAVGTVEPPPQLIDEVLASVDHSPAPRAAGATSGQAVAPAWGQWPRLSSLVSAPLASRSRLVRAPGSLVSPERAQASSVARSCFRAGSGSSECQARRVIHGQWRSRSGFPWTSR